MKDFQTPTPKYSGPAVTFSCRPAWFFFFLIFSFQQPVIKGTHLIPSRSETFSLEGPTAG